jgi:serine/threonine protein kinase/tetratricopeptide (TPR) repeat protein
MLDCPAEAKPLFLAAIRLPSTDRAAFIDSRCRDDLALRRWVEGLVAAHDAAARDTAREPPSDETTDYRLAHPGQVIGPYVLREQVGEGGMGLVFVAEQTSPVRRKVALKVIKPGMDTRQVVARFEAERQALALMDHPNIARVLDAGTTDDGRPYFVMELVKGVSITAHCDAQRLTLGQRLELFLQVCVAVQHAHQKGVIHRDLKPSNVLVAVHDVAAVVKVIDFGIAKAVGQTLTDKTVYTALAQMIGTPLYMSPEQAGQSSLDVDTRTDVYSLGVLLYELLTGTTPIAPETLRKAGYDEVRRVIREVDPDRPSARVSTLVMAARTTVAERRGADPRTLDRQLRGELDWVVMRCLEKDRDRRYESAGALAADVRRFLADEPVTARPQSLIYRARKFVRRNRTRVAVTGAAVGLALLVAVAGGWLYLARAGERDRTTAAVRDALAGGRAAVEAGDLNLAELRVAEARTGLGADPARYGALAAEVERLGDEVAERRAEADRFQQFLDLAADAQDRMGFSEHRGGHAVAERALGLYRVEADGDWPARLDASRLTGTQKARVREEVYVTLVSLADCYVRWRGLLGDDSRSARRGLELLGRAEAFHQPSRAFYFVRGRCRKLLKDPAAGEDERRYKEMAGTTALDYYLPGHTAGWEGDLPEAIRSYESALRIQPDHYNSLFFLGERLGKDKVNRREEAVQVLRGCFALRPTHVWAYITRAEHLDKLGRADEAVADLTTAVDRATNDMDRLAARFARIELYDRLGLAAKAREDRLGYVTLARRVVEQAAGRSGSPDPEILVLQNNLAVTYSDLGRHNEAIQILEPLLDRSIAVRSANHAETDTVVSNLGRAYSSLGRHDEAIRLFESAAERLGRTRGKDHKDTLFMTCQLGLAFVEAKRFAQAVPLLETAVAGFETKNGPNAPETLVAMDGLAAAHSRGGNAVAAIPLYESLVTRLKAARGADHPKALRAMNDLGAVYLLAGRAGDAVRVLEVVLDRRTATAGRDDPQTLAAMYDLASAHGDSGAWESADRLWKELVERRRRTDGSKSVATADALARYGMGLLNQRRYAEAEPVLRECLAVREKLMPDGWLRFNTTSQLGGALFGQKKYAAAEPLLLKGYEGLEQRAATIPPYARVRLEEAVERLAALYEATDRPAEAKRLRAKHTPPAAPPKQPLDLRK